MKMKPFDIIPGIFVMPYYNDMYLIGLIIQDRFMYI